MAHTDFLSTLNYRKELCCRTLIPWGETHKSNNMVKPFKVKMPQLAVQNNSIFLIPSDQQQYISSVKSGSK